MAAIPSGLTHTFGVIANRGKVFDTPDSPTDTYYGFLADIEDVVSARSGETLWSVQFDLVPLEWMESAVLAQSDKSRTPPPDGPVTLLIFDDARPDHIADALSTPVPEVVPGGWYIITLGKGGVGASRAPPTWAPKVQKLSARGLRAKRRDALRLSRRFRPVGKFSYAKIQAMLAAMAVREIGVMDVGQASCNLIYDANGVPQAYVDVGLPMHRNLGSLPPPNGLGNVEVINPGPCLAHSPPVILTHFHWDHYSMPMMSANRGALIDRDWVVPNQVRGVAANNILNAVGAARNGNVHVFPAALPGVIGGNVAIIQCRPRAYMAGGNLNNSGLAVVVTINGQMQHAMLPGDAAFQAIRGLGAFPNMRWLVASHHGSDVDLIQAHIPAPQAANQGRLAYSYGINGGPPGGVHCYGHPRAAAIADYLAVGWGHAGAVASTAETGPNTNVPGRGNIMMCHSTIPPPCRVLHCPFHIFPKILV